MQDKINPTIPDLIRKQALSILAYDYRPKKHMNLIYTTARIFDKYTHLYTTFQQLELAIAACTFIIAKLNDCHRTVYKLYTIHGNALLQTELVILQNFWWNLTTITPNQFTKDPVILEVAGWFDICLKRFTIWEKK